MKRTAFGLILSKNVCFQMFCFHLMSKLIPNPWEYILFMTIFFLLLFNTDDLGVSLQTLWCLLGPMWKFIFIKGIYRVIGPQRGLLLKLFVEVDNPDNHNSQFELFQLLITLYSYLLHELWRHDKIVYVFLVNLMTHRYGDHNNISLLCEKIQYAI